MEGCFRIYIMSVLQNVCYDDDSFIFRRLLYTKIQATLKEDYTVWFICYFQTHFLSVAKSGFLVSHSSFIPSACFRLTTTQWLEWNQIWVALRRSVCVDAFINRDYTTWKGAMNCKSLLFVDVLNLEGWPSPRWETLRFCMHSCFLCKFRILWSPPFRQLHDDARCLVLSRCVGCCCWQESWQGEVDT